MVLFQRRGSAYSASRSYYFDKVVELCRYPQGVLSASNIKAIESIYSIVKPVPLAKVHLGPTRKTSSGLAKHGTTQPCTDFAAREVTAKAPAHTNPIRESSTLAGLHRTVYAKKILLLSGAQIHHEDKE